ncbi:hypothetical protein TGAMA5MH_10980 [Trichoderma gamsii]|uniref:Uncharacterized protein n=1 Tax=Trichoderma gamsii TaxID=398673 RepID=A0A2K0SV29_9HYPO|nr:hypothetical protein TGAMA5MH_10980 [Trichoderma gamsii]
MHSFAWTLPTINLNNPSKDNLDNCTRALQNLFRDVLEATGKTRHQNGRSAPWWTKECKAAHRALEGSANGSPERAEAKKQLKLTVRKSKRAHWDKIIAEANADKNIWSLAKWRKATDRFQPPPLIDGDKSNSDPVERATFLRDKLLKRKTTEEDLPDPWEGDLPQTRRSNGTQKSQRKKPGRPRQDPATLPPGQTGSR